MLTNNWPSWLDKDIPSKLGRNTNNTKILGSRKLEKRLSKTRSSVFQLELNVALPLAHHQNPVFPRHLPEDAKDPVHVGTGARSNGWRWKRLEHVLHLEHGGVHEELCQLLHQQSQIDFWFSWFQEQKSQCFPVKLASTKSWSVLLSKISFELNLTVMNCWISIVRVVIWSRSVSTSVWMAAEGVETTNIVVRVAVEPDSCTP